MRALLRYYMSLSGALHGHTAARYLRLYNAQVLTRARQESNVLFYLMLCPDDIDFGAERRRNHHYNLIAACNR